MKITVGIPTKDRLDYLSHTLLSIALQTIQIHEVIIVDDSDNPINLASIPLYEYALRLLNDYGVKWKVIFGRKMGQHYSHQIVQEIAEGDWIFRVDDDCVLEPDCIEKLVAHTAENVGAVAPSVLLPTPTKLPAGLNNDIRNMGAPNIQWFKFNGIRDVDHLYSCFLYRKGIARYELGLSRKAHREETIFSHSIKRAGYKLLVNGDARVWHWRAPQGGIRSDNNIQDFAHDEQIFESYLRDWGIIGDGTKAFVLDCGLGDHMVFKSLIPNIKEQFKKFKIYATFPFVFTDDEVELGSIAEAKLLYGNIDRFNLYRHMIDIKHETELREAFKSLYNIKECKLPSTMKQRHLETA